jgi:hypothetical protein
VMVMHVFQCLLSYQNRYLLKFRSDRSICLPTHCE